MDRRRKHYLLKIPVQRLLVVAKALPKLCRHTDKFRISVGFNSKPVLHNNSPSKHNSLKFSETAINFNQTPVIKSFFFAEVLSSASFENGGFEEALRKPVIIIISSKKTP